MKFIILFIHNKATLWVINVTGQGEGPAIEWDQSVAVTNLTAEIFF